MASETWAQAFRDLSRFSGDADGFRGWVTSIGRHRALDHLRRRARRPQSALELAEIEEPLHREDVEERVLAVLSTEAAVELIRRLPPDQAEAVMLRAVLGFDARTAGEILGKRPGAVRTASYRGTASDSPVLLEAEPALAPAAEPAVTLSCRRGAEGVR